MERMNPLDATFLAIEDTVNHMHIGSVVIFEGPPPRYEEVGRAIEAVLPLVPRYRQKVRVAPASIGRPLWVDDPHFRIDYHLRHAALPPSNDGDELRRLVGWVMSQQLDRHKPLWETWMIEGLPGDAWALLTKVHHCMVDGIAGTDLLSVLFDLSADGTPDRPVAEPWVPQPEPGAFTLARHSLGGIMTAPVARARWMAGLLTRPADTVGRLLKAARGLHDMGRLVRPAPVSRLTGPIGPHRRWDHTEVSLADVKAVRSGLGGTVNDVVLALVTRGIRELLLGWDEDVAGREVRTLVPVSVRDADARGVFDNRVSSIFALLPVGIADAAERLDEVRRQMEHLKVSGEIDAGNAVVALVDFAPPLLHALLARILVHRQHSVETVATNVPGPQFPLYVAGRKMIAAYPYVPLAGNIRVGVAIWSYLGTLYFGVTGDDDAGPDIHRVCAGIDDGMRELSKLAREKGPRMHGDACISSA
ncbi:MAG TPA: wax ester/triacylglycerol synthase family O-acyltransferase [Acidimicrobiia bacterium]|nr:wax ester/triacylglycerol synthase family O-acyltransferase [Acidimicrobiia bacterium]